MSALPISCPGCTRSATFIAWVRSRWACWWEERGDWVRYEDFFEWERRRAEPSQDAGTTLGGAEDHAGNGGLRAQSEDRPPVRIRPDGNPRRRSAGDPPNDRRR